MLLGKKLILLKLLVLASTYSIQSAVPLALAALLSNAVLLQSPEQQNASAFPAQVYAINDSISPNMNDRSCESTNIQKSTSSTATDSTSLEEIRRNQNAVATALKKIKNKKIKYETRISTLKSTKQKSRNSFRKQHP